jgi:ribosomal protein L40E
VPRRGAAWAAGWIGGEPRGLGSPWGLATYGAAIVAYLLLQHLAFVKAIDRTYLPHVRRALCDRGLRVCLRCGHRLGPAAVRCPECGAAEPGEP